MNQNAFPITHIFYTLSTQTFIVWKDILLLSWMDFPFRKKSRSLFWQRVLYKKMLSVLLFTLPHSKNISFLFLAPASLFSFLSSSLVLLSTLHLLTPFCYFLLIWGCWESNQVPSMYLRRVLSLNYILQYQNLFSGLTGNHGILIIHYGSRKYNGSCKRARINYTVLLNCNS